ncbi:MAG: NAD(P)-dependent oxidoreductase [Planctomycetota bacterium]|nr:NAD(P)-dependent oxidoreductase [Planctomycetota bacterium]
MRIGWIGCGVMGTSMVGHLLENGHGVRVFTRTRSKAVSLLERGADWAESPREAAEGMDAVVSIVGFPEDVGSVHLGAQGTLTATRVPSILIDMTTSDPGLAIRLHVAAAQRGVAAIDAPVSGGDVGARNGTLSIMIGGDPAAVEMAQPIFEACGGTIVHQGGPGAGQKTKIVNQILVAASMIGACEAILFAARAGLDARTVLKSVATGAAGSWTLSNLVPRMLEANFEPGFFIDHFVKDLGIAVHEARATGLDLPGLEMAERFYREAKAEGLGSKGTQALLLLLEARQRD